MKLSTWEIDTTHSSITFSVRHMVFAKVRGRFSAWTGSVQFDGADPTKGSVSVVIDASSIDTGTADRDTHLRSGDFLDVANFPELRFTSQSLESLGSDRYRLHGELTIRDTTRPVALEVTYNGQAQDPWGKQRAGFTATTSLDRREFGLAWNQVLEAGGVLVGEKIEIEIEIQAVNSAAAPAA